GRDPVAAEDGHPDERLGNTAVVGGWPGDEDGRALGNRPHLALELLAFKCPRPWRLAHEDRLPRLVGLARGARDSQRDGRPDPLHPTDVLVAVGPRTVRGLRRPGQE